MRNWFWFHTLPKVRYTSVSSTCLVAEYPWWTAAGNISDLPWPAAHLWGNANERLVFRSRVNGKWIAFLVTNYEFSHQEFGPQNVWGAEELTHWRERNWITL